MRYFDLKQRKKLSNKKVDAFLTDFHKICRKHKMILSAKERKVCINRYNKLNVKKLFDSIVTNFSSEEDEKQLKNKNTELNKKK